MNAGIQCGSNYNISVYLGNRQFPFQLMSMPHWRNNKGNGFQLVGCDCFKSTRMLTGIRKKKKCIVTQNYVFIKFVCRIMKFGVLLLLASKKKNNLKMKNDTQMVTKLLHFAKLWRLRTAALKNWSCLNMCFFFLFTLLSFRHFIG